MSGQPDATVANNQYLRVTFISSDPGNGATYQWEKSSATGMTDPYVPLAGETGNTFQILSVPLGTWIHVIVTPIDSTGRVKGTPVVSPPVHVGS